MDKMPFLKSKTIDDIMKDFTIKAGDYEIDYGDQHFRRSDAGNAIYNPFIENYIMDEVSVEIGGEIYFHPKCGIIIMAGVSNPEANPIVLSPSQIDTATGMLNKSTPAYHGKVGYDKQFTKDFRFRITGSIYVDQSATDNQLFSGDVAGSRYYFVMENTTATDAGNAYSGRYDPQFTEQVTTFMINPFIKFQGLELFGTYEMAKGRLITEPDMRTATQYAVDLIYRFPRNKENFWIGGRYNTVMAALPLVQNDITINRVVGSLGWFVTKNIMLKTEYVNQQYLHFASTDIRSNGRFDGFMIEGSIAF